MTKPLRLGLGDFIGVGFLRMLQNDYREGFPASTRLQALGMCCDTWDLAPALADRVLRSPFTVDGNVALVALVAAPPPVQGTPWWARLRDQFDAELRRARSQEG